MSFFKSLFSKKDEPIHSYADFWAWFKKREKQFYKIVQGHVNIETEFFDPLSAKLKELGDNYFFLAGMSNTQTAELVVTADGSIKDIVFVEELVAAAPAIAGWKFTALKPAQSIESLGIKMDGLAFNQEYLFFYPNEFPEYPDEIDITVVHKEFNKGDSQALTTGSYIFLDHYLGELHFATAIDNLRVVGTEDATAELIPIEKLKHYLIWREKEFVEKYEAVKFEEEDNKFANFQGELESGNLLIAIINLSVLEWEHKASHPWIMKVEIRFDGSEFNGLTDEPTEERITEFEDVLLERLPQEKGYVYIGRQTAESVRELYFACQDFRKPSKVVHEAIQDFSGEEEISYQIYKDKYWQSFQRFQGYT